MTLERQELYQTEPLGTSRMSISQHLRGLLYEVSDEVSGGHHFDCACTLPMLYNVI